MEYKISENRMAHMHGVAEFMYEHAPLFRLNPDVMYILGLLHDIGYVHGKHLHEVHGSEMMENLAFPYADIIKFHGTTPSAYMQMLDCRENEIPKELILLWMADMSVDLTGKNVGYNARLDDIGTRLGFDSLAYMHCKETISFLMNFDKSENCRK